MSSILELLSFGARFKKLRKERGFTTQESISEALYVSKTTISAWETGTLPDIERLPDICSVLDCDINYLFGEIEEYKMDTHDVSDVTGLSEKAIERLKKIYDFKKERLGNANNFLKVINNLIENADMFQTGIVSLIELYSHHSINTGDVTLKNRNEEISFSPDIIMEGILVMLQGEVQKYRQSVQSSKKSEKEGESSGNHNTKEE